MDTVADVIAGSTCGRWLPAVVVSDNGGNCEGVDVEFNQAL